MEIKLEKRFNTMAIKMPPEGEEINVSLRESNGEHKVYSCIYMGMGIFKFLSDNSQRACEIVESKEELKIYLLGKEIIGWWKPRKMKGDKK